MSCLQHWKPLPESWREAVWRDSGAALLESTLASPDQHRSLLFTRPQRFLTVESADEIPDFFDAIEQALAQGHHLAGFLSYELGSLMQGVPAHDLPAGTCLARLGVYPQPAIFDHLACEGDVEPAATNRSPQPLRLAMLPTMPRGDYLAAIRQVQGWIAQGDTYQVNFTTAVQSRFDGDGLAIYNRLTREQPCSYSALLHANEHEAILSLSPELFFHTSSTGQITTRPMKGTAARSAGAADDEAARALSLDEKNRAEHVMIVDLLRNDLGRICETGSVAVEGLFHVERYPTVHQMVSTVRGQLRANTRWQQIFASLFPSGSITGAPKRRTMQLIRKLERGPRGVYTGAIGYIAPSGESAFSVAIRTVVLKQTAQGGVATMGVGGGIVADSNPEDEWKECLLKASFLQRASAELKLIETMLIENGTVSRLELHLQRLFRSAQALGFNFSPEEVKAAVQQQVAQTEALPKRLRLTVSRVGEIEAHSEPLQPWPSSLRICIATQRTDRNDPSLCYKTTFRQTYDDAFSSAKCEGFDEALFLNSDEELTEGCVTNLIVHCSAGWFTPALACGVLPGIFREGLVISGQIQETVLRVQDLKDADAVFLCNSVRGLVPVRSVHWNAHECLQFAEEAAQNLRSSLLQLLKP